MVHQSLQHKDRQQVLIPEMAFDDWYQSFKEEWFQGEHVALIGQTGTGKTTVAHHLLDIRSYVAVLAIKRQDDTLERFKRGENYGRSAYTVIHKWPPDFPTRHVILWVKPKSLSSQDIKKQSLAIHRALNQMYLSGGWCIYLDEAGYLAGTLGLSSAIGILLNQGRSAHISVVATMTRPSSVVARIPRESLTQVRHHLIFKYTDAGEMESCGKIVGINLGTMRSWQEELRTNLSKGHSDFIYVGKGKNILVRNA